MRAVCLDTSFLITFADPTRPHHADAVEYFRHFLSQNIPMFVSTLAAAEFEVGQPVTDLPLQNFRFLPYNLSHARVAASFLRALRSGELNRDPADARKVVSNDLGILAQAKAENISIVITEDESTLVRMAARLREAGLASTETLLLRDGFTPGRLEDPRQGEIAFPPSNP